MYVPAADAHNKWWLSVPTGNKKNRLPTGYKIDHKFTECFSAPAPHVMS